MKSLAVVLVLFFVPGILLFAQFDQPFEWKTKLENKELIVEGMVPNHHHLYADRTKITAKDNAGKDLVLLKAPRSEKYTDDFGTNQVFHGEKTFKWFFSRAGAPPFKVTIDYQGCREKIGDEAALCFLPDTKTFELGEDKKLTTPVNNNPLPSPSKTVDLESQLNEFTVVRTHGGYLNSQEFLRFLDLGKNKFSANPLTDLGIIGMIFTALLGGLALNLTPCVLPMIPINLAIIGAGGQAESKSSGFTRGGIYGLGIAGAYGVLGVVAILTGAKFGTLNSLPIFNFAIAGIFILLAMAMFDLINIDFSKFSSKLSPTASPAGKLIPTFILGIVAALLAGACVAPVVIFVLVESATLYANGQYLAILLPFILGLGMAIPWPIAGAGMSILPKPGKWMVKIKYGFGVMIILFALWYLKIGFDLFSVNNSQESVSDSMAALSEGLEQAQKENKPIFIDFWASWCKNCLHMEATTFKNPKVIKELHGFIEIKFQAEKPNSPEVKKILDRFGVVGLPGYVLLTPKEKNR